MSGGRTTTVHLLDPAVVIESPTELHRAPYIEMRRRWLLSPGGGPALVDEPDQADVILAPITLGYGLRFEALRRSAVIRRHAARLFVYSPDDNVFPLLPGLYPSVTRHWTDRGWAIATHYVTGNEYHRFDPAAVSFGQRQHLFSFVGSSRTHPVRETLLQLAHPRAHLHDSNPPNSTNYWWQDPEAKARFLALYREVMHQTQFALCPRGVSPASIRLFEAMEAGCVPVIISDGQVLPPGPDWSQCSLTVAERDAGNVVALLERHLDDAPRLAANARAAWETYFAPERTAATVGAWLAQLAAHLTPSRRASLQRTVYFESLLEGRLNRNRARGVIDRLRGRR